MHGQEGRKLSRAKGQRAGPPIRCFVAPLTCLDSISRRATEQRGVRCRRCMHNAPCSTHTCTHAHMPASATRCIEPAAGPLGAQWIAKGSQSMHQSPVPALNPLLISSASPPSLLVYLFDRVLCFLRSFPRRLLRSALSPSARAPRPPSFLSFSLSLFPFTYIRACLHARRVLSPRLLSRSLSAPWKMGSRLALFPPAFRLSPPPCVLFVFLVRFLLSSTCSAASVRAPEQRPVENATTTRRKKEREQSGGVGVCGDGKRKRTSRGRARRKRGQTERSHNGKKSSQRGQTGNKRKRGRPGLCCPL